ncbi:hypothetical protein OsJ_06665 [Oryza sativa Japonica Group]|uniref:Uncharacterized protein n=1 Tax=Oryza sativa subsp. japonica TaxID=39947 RepID=B9EZW4_ORYSJ|nr:hypothetical protein OsJ_06665 [Oryza sativa Japonica Group]
MPPPSVAPHPPTHGATFLDATASVQHSNCHATPPPSPSPSWSIPSRRFPASSPPFRSNIQATEAAGDDILDEDILTSVVGACRSGNVVRIKWR